MSPQIIGAGVASVVILGIAARGPIARWLQRIAARDATARGRRTFDLPVLDSAPHEAPCRALEDQARGLWRDRDLDGLSRLLGQHVAAPRMMPDGARSYDTVTFAVLAPLFEARGPEALARVLGSYRRRLSPCAADPALTGLWLRALQTAAWLGRGMARDYRVPGAALADFRARTGEIEATLAAAGHDPAASILLAEPLAHAAAARPDAREELPRRFALVERLDPLNARIWAERARLALPGWFGSETAVGAVMEGAVGALRHTHGESVLVNVTMAVQDALPPEHIPGWSEPRFLAALADLATEESGQLDLNHVAARLDAAGRGHLAEEVLRRHLTEIHASAWDSGTGYLDLHAGAEMEHYPARAAAVEAHRSTSRILAAG